MANSRALTDRRLPARGSDGAERQPVTAVPAAAGYADSGQPVDDLPPLEEFGFDEPIRDDAIKQPTKTEPAKAELTNAEPPKGEAPKAKPARAKSTRPERTKAEPANVEAIGQPAKDGSAADELPAKEKAVEPAESAPVDPPLPKFLAAPDEPAVPVPLAGTEPVVASDPKQRERRSAWRGRFQEALQRWPNAARAVLPSDRRSRVAIGAGAAAVVVIVVAVVGGLGPLSRGRNYRSSPPPSDPAQRFAFYQGGAKSGDANAELQLAILYAKGDGVAQDYAAAATWFRAAADQGVARAQYDLGVLYERGRGVPVDLNEAANWYLKAANGKFPLAEYNLAVCYAKGQGIRQDLPEAALWYRRAAGHGVVQAMINLGTTYEKGDGIAASPVDAYAWYLAAGQRGNQPAAQRAQDVFASLPRLDQIRAEALASDVAASIRNPEPERGETAMEKPDAKSNAPDR